MILAVASGKGGTGKTTVTAALTSVWDSPVTAVDLDVEEPNLHLFLKPDISTSFSAHIEVPVVDMSSCSGCGACSEICQFKAIVVMGGIPHVFPEMCHGCRGCMLVCPEKAISSGKRELGSVSLGHAGDVRFAQGTLRVGEAMSPPLMREVKQHLDHDEQTAGRDIIIDAPPGVSCPAVSAVMDSDCIVLVTEPTPFGLNDFALAWDAFSPQGKPMGAVINRAGIGDDGVHNFCRDKGIPIWAEIPYDPDVAHAYCKGQIVADAVPALRPVFQQLAESARQAVQGGTPHA